MISAILSLLSDLESMAVKQSRASRNTFCAVEAHELSKFKQILSHHFSKSLSERPLPSSDVMCSSDMFWAALGPCGLELV